jgi:hypothetical protein
MRLVVIIIYCLIKTIYINIGVYRTDSSRSLDFSLDYNKANSTVKFCPNIGERREEEIIQRRGAIE